MFSLLHLKGIDTSDPEDYKLKFVEEGYPRGSIQDIADVVGDTSRPPFNSALGYTQLNKEPYNTILKARLGEINTELDLIFAKGVTIDTIRQNQNYNTIIEHFNRNIPTPNENGEIITNAYSMFGPAKITYPNPNEIDDLKIIFTHYLLLQTQLSGKTIDEWIDGFSTIQRMFIRYYKDVMGFIINYDKATFKKITTYPGQPGCMIDEGGSPTLFMYYNAINNSYKSAKYGIHEWGMTLLNGGLLDINNTRRDRKITNNSSGDAFVEGLDVPFGDNAISLKMLIALQYNNISGLILGFIHEFTHELGAGHGGLRLNSNAKDIVNRFLPKSVFDCAFRAKGYTGSINPIYDELLADFIGILFFDKYITNLPETEKYDAVRFSTVVFNTGNEIEAGHPPTSLRRNLILVSKTIHTILKTMPDYNNRTYMATNITCKLFAQGKRIPTNYNFTQVIKKPQTWGGKRTRKNKNKNRKSTRRHRM